MTNLLTHLKALLRPEAQRRKKPVVLTPLSFDNGQSQVVGIFIRDPDTYEIIAEAFDRVTFAEKAGLPRGLASEIWDDCRRAAREAAEERRCATAEGSPLADDEVEAEAQGNVQRSTCCTPTTGTSTATSPTTSP